MGAPLRDDDEDDRRGRRRVYGRFRIAAEGLFLGSTPTPCNELDIDDVLDRRRILCRRYSNCLTYAASEGWDGFTCESCCIREKLSPNEQHLDLEGLALFLMALELQLGWHPAR